MHDAGKPDYLYHFLLITPLVAIAFYFVGSRLEKWFKARYAGFRSNWFRLGLLISAIGLVYAIAAPAPGSQGELVHFRSLFGKSAYEKAVEETVARLLTVPRILPAEPYFALDTLAKSNEKLQQQAEALLQNGLYERSTRPALNLYGRVDAYRLSETGRKFYNEKWHGLDYGDMRLVKLLNWRYLGLRDKHWRERRTTSRGVPLSSRNVAEYSSAAPRAITFRWEFIRLEDWARAPGMTEAFPLLKDQLLNEEKTHGILVYEGRVEGVTPWEDPTLPDRYYQMFPLPDYRQIDQPDPADVRLNEASLREGIDTYLYNYTGFKRFLPGGDQDEALRRAAGAEPNWAALDARRLYDKFWADQRSEANEKADNDKLMHQSRNLENLGNLSRNLSELGKQLDERRGFPESPNPLPPAFQGKAAGERRFAVFQVDKIISRGAPYAKAEPDGWLYQRVSFSCKIARKAPWTADKEVRKAMPAMAELLDSLDAQVFNWIIRYKEPAVAEYGGTRYQCEVYFDRASASGI